MKFVIALVLCLAFGCDVETGDADGLRYDPSCLDDRLHARRVAEAHVEGEVHVRLHPMNAVDLQAVHSPQMSTVTGAHRRWLVGPSTRPIAWGLHLPVGATITRWKINAEKNTGSLNAITGALYKGTNAGLADTMIGAPVSSVMHAPGTIILQNNNISDVVIGDLDYTLVFTPGGGIVPAPDCLYGAEIFYLPP